MHFSTFRCSRGQTRAKYVRRHLSTGPAQLEEGGRRPPSVFFYFFLKYIHTSFAQFMTKPNSFRFSGTGSTSPAKNSAHISVHIHVDRIWGGVVEQSAGPTDRPSDRPTDRPTDRPSVRPFVRPADRRSDRPSDRPSVRQCDRPSVCPSVRTIRYNLV